ncbi:MAG: c-type cytochrome [Bacteriovoracaceae bacterium]|nr:c-type cytochrome [Bacteriovoracaceae bacterium]
MESRLVLFIIFISLSIGALSLGGYKKYFDNTRSLDIRKLAVKGTESTGEAMAEAAVVEVLPQAVTLDTPEMIKAHEIYTVSGQCIKCHGEFGQGNPKEEAPLIAGQYDWYVLEQLNHMKAGRRNNEKMKPYLKNLDTKDFEILAQYISKLRAGKKAE